MVASSGPNIKMDPDSQRANGPYRINTAQTGVLCYLNFSNKECTLYMMKFLMMQMEQNSCSSQPFTGHLSSLNTKHCRPVIYFCQICVHRGNTEDYKNAFPPKEKVNALAPLENERY